MIMMMIMIKRERITKANIFLDFLGINTTLLWSALKIFFIDVPKQRRLRFVQFLVSILR